MRRLVVAALVVLPLSACTLQASPEPGDETTAASYTYVLESSGERALLGRYAVTVDGSHVTAAVDLADGTPVPESLVELVPTIDELTDRVTTGGPSEVSYDAHTGWLVSVRFEGDPKAIDDEECYAISEYSPT